MLHSEIPPTFIPTSIIRICNASDSIEDQLEADLSEKSDSSTSSNTVGMEVSLHADWNDTEPSTNSSPDQCNHNSRPNVVTAVAVQDRQCMFTCRYYNKTIKN